MHFMGWPGYLSDQQGYDFYRQMLETLVRHGRERGVQVAMENMPENRDQHKHFREIFHRVPGLRLLYDVAHGNLATTKSMLRHYLLSLGDRLVHVHISDNDGTQDLHLPFGTPAARRPGSAAKPAHAAGLQLRWNDHRRSVRGTAMVAGERRSGAGTLGRKQANVILEAGSSGQ